MKKAFILVMVVMLACTVLAVTGCGGDTAKAKEYMKEADEAWSKLDSDLQELDSKSTALMTAALTGNMEAIKVEDLQLVKESTEKVLPEFKKVEALYNKIVEECEDCPDYAEYADLMLRALEKDQEVVQAGADLLAELQPVMESGDMAQLEVAITAAQTEIANIQKLQKEADKLFEEASGWKDSKELDK